MDNIEFLSVDDQINRLKEKGLTIRDESRAAEILQETSYSTLVGYFSPFFYANKKTKHYKKGTTFDEVHALYLFNHNICALYLTYILAAERKLKTLIADCFAKYHSSTGYWDPSNFSPAACKKEKGRESKYDILIKSIQEQINRLYPENDKDPKKYRDTPFQYFRNKKRSIPIWLLVNTFSFGLMRKFYNAMQDDDKKKIYGFLQIDHNCLEDGLDLLNNFRNHCAHLEKIVDFYNQRYITIAKGEDKTQYFGVYGVTFFLKKLLSTTEFMVFFSDLNKCFEKLAPNLHVIDISFIKRKMRFPADDTIVLQELGTYSKGIILSDFDFLSLLERYILPLIPYAVGKPDHVKESDSFGKEKAELLHYFDVEETLCFSQSIESKYTVKIKLPKSFFSEDLLQQLKTQLEYLIHYLQIVWNANKANDLLQKQEKTFLFETDSEIAYQLALCKKLCEADDDMLIAEKKKLIRQKRYIEKDLQSARTEHSIDTEKMLMRQRKETNNRLNQIDKELAHQYQHCYKRRETLYSILSCFDRWAVKTYEGKHMPFGVIINNNTNDNDKFDYIEFLKMDYSATITDGLYSCVEIQANGKYNRHIATDAQSNSLETVPYPHQGFAQSCNDNKIGVLLTDNGDIIIIKNQKMICSKHNGHWTFSMHEYAISKLMSFLTEIPNEKRKNAATTIYRTLIDVSYSHGGACIAIAKDSKNPELLRMTYPTLLNEDDKNIVLKAIKDKKQEDLTRSEKAETRDSLIRINALKGFAGGYAFYYELDAFLRRELIEMDGALVLGPKGEIHAVASIINPNGASVYSGARTTAAIRLSNHGLGIKVSQDGYIKFYENEEETLSI